MNFSCFFGSFWHQRKQVQLQRTMSKPFSQCHEYYRFDMPAIHFQTRTRQHQYNKEPGFHKPSAYFTMQNHNVLFKQKKSLLVSLSSLHFKKATNFCNQQKLLYRAADFSDKARPIFGSWWNDNRPQV